MADENRIFRSEMDKMFKRRAAHTQKTLLISFALKKVMLALRKGRQVNERLTFGVLSSPKPPKTT